MFAGSSFRALADKFSRKKNFDAAKNRKSGSHTPAHVRGAEWKNYANARQTHTHMHAHVHVQGTRKKTILIVLLIRKFIFQKIFLPRIVSKRLDTKDRGFFLFRQHGIWWRSQPATLNDNILSIDMNNHVLAFPRVAATIYLIFYFGLSNLI